MCSRGKELNTSILQVLFPYTLSFSTSPYPASQGTSDTLQQTHCSRSAIHVTLAVHRMKRDSQPADISSYHYHVPCCPADTLLSPAVTGTVAFLPCNSNHCSVLEREKRTQLGSSSLIYPFICHLAVYAICIHFFSMLALCHLLPRDFSQLLCQVLESSNSLLHIIPLGQRGRRQGDMILCPLGFYLMLWYTFMPFISQLNTYSPMIQI